MKNPDREKVSLLDELPNIGKAIAAYLHLIGTAREKHNETDTPTLLADIF